MRFSPAGPSGDLVLDHVGLYVRDERIEARTFGSDNIAALCAAVEAERSRSLRGA